jgi:enamine deaminase RidA (YjgF/YER057c/UK114 family)
MEPPVPCRSINSDEVYDTTGAGFDHARLAGGTLISAGVVGWTRDRRLPGDGGLREQLGQALRNAEAICRSAGTMLSAASHIRVYVVGRADEARPVLHELMTDLLERPFPPMTLVGVGSLAVPDLLAEIEFSVADVG